MDQDMLNENLNNRSWKNKLEDVDSLPGDVLQDKNAAWEKLYGRLHKQPRNRMFAWYWIAAACLLAALIVPVFISNKKLVETAAGKKLLYAPAKTETQMSTVKKNTAPVVDIISNQKNVTGQPGTIVHQKISSGKIPVKKIPVEAMLLQEKLTATVPSIQIQPLQIPLTNKLVAATNTEKKKMKVVHVNELGTPLPELRSRTATDDYSVIQFNLVNQRVYSKPPAGAGSTGFGPLKSKNISN